MSLKANEFDTIVIGGGLSGLIVACGLSQNQKVALIEKSELPGGMCRSNSGYKELSPNFQSIPFSEETQKALNFLEVVTGSQIHREKMEQQPLTYDQGFKPFIGFGESAPLCVEELQYYLSTDRLHLHTGPNEWIHTLYEKFKGEFLNLSQVTKLLIENNRCIGVIINGQKQVTGKNVVFCCNPKELLHLTEPEALPLRIRQKISKSLLWTSVLIQFIHSRVVSESSAVHILSSKSESDSFCIGQFNAPIRLENGSQQQSSQWLSFTSEYDSDDEELLGQSVKRMKKLIQRAFPDSLSQLKYEKILVNPQSHGHIHINLEENTSISGIENLYIVSPLTSDLKNIAGSVQLAEQCLKGLGYCSAQ